MRNLDVMELPDQALYDGSLTAKRTARPSHSFPPVPRPSVSERTVLLRKGVSHRWGHSLQVGDVASKLVQQYNIRVCTGLVSSTTAKPKPN